MKYIEKSKNQQHGREAYIMEVTIADLETLDLILSMYSPFLAQSNKILLMDGREMSLGQRLKKARWGINKVKKEIMEKKV